LFESKLRQEYGSFVKFRVWESHLSGYPHCHVVYYFHNKWFKVFEHNKKYRITNKHKKKISNFWNMGNVDIQGVQDTHGAFSEVKKYITKNIWNPKGNLTNAMICLHRKQMYWISRCNPFKKRFKLWFKEGLTDWKDQERAFLNNISKWAKKDFIGAIWGSQIYFQFYNKERSGMAEPTTTALVRDTLCNCNNEYPEIAVWRYRGCVNYEDIKRFLPNISDKWVIKAEPPPDMLFLLGLGHDELSFKSEF